MHKFTRLFLLFGLFLYSAFVSSQNITVSYRFLKENNPVADYELNIEKDHSLFYESDYCSKNINQKSELVIFKDKSNEVKLLDKVGEVLILTKKPNQFNWTIKKEKKMIGGYSCQQAEILYKNKKWTAWFTSDLPFQDGPFIFNGLPGLILMIENNEYRFELLEINKGANECALAISTERKEIPYEKYDSLFSGISNKNDALLKSLGNLNLKLEMNINSINEKEKKINIIRDIL